TTSTTIHTYTLSLHDALPIFGIPDEKSGEAVKLFVVKKDPALSEEQIIEHCRKYLTGYKIPHEVEFRDELPKTNVGKVLRRALRSEEHTSELQSRENLVCRLL